MSKFLSFEVQRGAEDSADSEDLVFKVKSKEIKDDLLYLNLKFEHSEKVSTGSLNDFIVIRIEDDSFFTS